MCGHSLWLVLSCAICMLGLDARPVVAEEPEAERGEYLVNLLACGRCHTEGYLVGNEPTGPDLAGSAVGIAYSGSADDGTPGLVFAPNLTPDMQTGLGTWSQRDIVRALITGVGTDGHQRLPVMPWQNYGALTNEDLSAVAAYLKSLPPIKRSVPERTVAGGPPVHPYVRFGLYVFVPFEENPISDQ
jgi:mono/diheme cytochrome c family protein